MLRKWLMVLLSTTMIFPSPKEVNHEPFLLTEVDTKGMELNKLEDEFVVPNIGYDNIKKEIEIREKINKIVEERLNRIKEIHERQLEKEKIEKEKHKRTFLVTYYGSTYNECGNNHYITASGIPVSRGHIAVPRSIPFGSKIILEGNEYIATDTGNPKYICELPDGTLRVDIYVERLDSEIGNDYAYEKRINNMGTKTIEGELYIKE